jgi:hypothetical protein
VLRAWLLVVVLAAGCTEPPGEVLVDLRTDLVPLRELGSVRTELGARRETFVARSIDDFLRGVRIAELGGVARGPQRLRVSLLGPAGDAVLVRDLTVEVNGRVVVTVVMTRSCLGVACPGPGDPPSHEACFGGRCVDPGCSAERPEACGTEDCNVDLECLGASCEVGTCRDATCFFVPDDDRCDVGERCIAGTGCVALGPDAGPSDSGPPDGGPPDAPADAPRDAGPPPLDDTACDDVHAGAIVCDGFESGDGSMWGATIESPGGALDVLGPPPVPYRGAYAVSARWAMDARVEAYLELEPLGTPRTSGDLYLRGYVYVPGTTAFDTVNFLGLGENVSPVEGTTVMLRMGSLATYSGTAGTTLQSSFALPRDTWLCVELHVRIGNAGAIDLYADEMRVAGADPIDTLPGGGISRLTIGAAQYDPRTTPAGTIHLDEVVLDDAPIGCDR